MEDYAELEPNPSNELACYLYFYQDESFDDKSKSKKDTGHEDSQNQHPVEKPDSGELQQQKFKPQAIRSRGIIQVGENMKSKYISTKKGTASQTNVLAINSKTFLKKMILKKFQNYELSISSAQKEFLSSKANLENFKIFFHQSHEFLCDKSEDDDKNKDSQKFRDFCEEQLCQSMTIKKIFHSKKMNLKNKLIMIKYLECLKNSCLNPDRFSNWKGLHHINLKN